MQGNGASSASPRNRAWAKAYRQGIQADQGRAWLPGTGICLKCCARNTVPVPHSLESPSFANRPRANSKRKHSTTINATITVHMPGLPQVCPDRSLKRRHVGKRLHSRRVAETSTGTSAAGIQRIAIDRGIASALATDCHRGSRPCPSVHPHVAGSTAGGRHSKVP